jgi:hypothetical protein
LSLAELIGAPPGSAVASATRRQDAPAELMAEAIRAYMRNPNWMKSAAPATARNIRKAVNRDPFLSRIIQFNSIPPLLAAGAAGGAAAQAGKRSES